jgi:hypothetical protein
MSKYPLVNSIMGSWFISGIGSPFIWNHQVGLTCAAS